jgi:multidrug efflux pump subunit AcrA (membrane-fusion protein)
VKVIDPSSLRFEGLVSADSVGELKAGQHVWFKVHGFSTEEFTGVITRVNPAANVTTRQVEVLVSFDAASKQPNVAGLYAEGHVETRSSANLSLPNASIVREGDNAFAWRVSAEGVARSSCGHWARTRRARRATRRAFRFRTYVEGRASRPVERSALVSKNSVGEYQTCSRNFSIGCRSRRSRSSSSGLGCWL